MDKKLVNLKDDFIETTYKLVLDKCPLLHIDDKESIDKGFEVVNSMDDKIVSDYIEYYCYQYIESIKDTSLNDVLTKIPLFSTRIYSLIVPNSCLLKYMRVSSENVRKFLNKIDTISRKIKLEIFEDFIIEKKPLKNLSGYIFTKVEVLRIVIEYIHNNYDMFEKYVEHFIRIGLNERIKMNIRLQSYAEIHAIILKVIIGTGTYAGSLIQAQELNIIRDFIDEKYNDYCISLVNDCISKNKSLTNINYCVINKMITLNTFLKLDKNKKELYVRNRMDYYLSKRKVMSFEEFKKDIHGGNIAPAKMQGYIKEYEEIKIYIDSLYDSYAEKLIKNNKNEIKLDSDKWILAYKDGPRVKYRSFEFNDIHSEKFKYEIKLYLMDECTRKLIRNINTLSLVKKSLNFLYDRDKSCDSFAKIDLGDVRALDNYLQKGLYVKKADGTNKKRSVSTISKTMGKLKQVIEFLIKYSKRNKLKTPTPEWNIFSGVRYTNIDSMSKRTDVIPDYILEQMDKFTHELSEEHQLMYEVFQNTGMRASSVCKLKANCIKPSRYNNVKILKYKPYKLRKVKKKLGETQYEEIIISLELAEKIQVQIEKTKDLREKYNLDYIFLNSREEKGILWATRIDSKSFQTAINRMIKRNNITDYNGKLWHFESRQFRKTLVAVMKNNNATDEEIAYVLGHHSRQTLNKYYKEIEEQRLENLNHEFFKKRFGIDIGEENLSQFSEQEKRCLYIDFVTKYRRVPLGYCSKHIKDGPCNKKSGASSCEKCSKICTGEQYLSGWINLRDDRKRELNDLIQYYKKNNIILEEYKEFKEYKHILYEFNLYQDAIDKIKKGCNERE